MPELWMKDKPVLMFEEANGIAVSIKKIYSPELLPLCLSEDVSVENFNSWLNKRKMPENREELSEIVNEFGNDWCLSKNKASLSDQYWVKYRMEEWGKINYFTRFYSQDVGDITFMPWKSPKRRINSDSPDLMTNGVLKKRWKQNEDKSSVLIKAGSRRLGQEPLSEVLTSVLLEQLNIIPFVRYDFCVEGVDLCSRCNNFITQDTELVPASYIYNLEQRETGVSVYEHLIRMCDKFEIIGARDFIDGMVFIDTITGNEDRNLGNIGFVRNMETLKLEAGPLFDFGASYWSSGKIDNRVKSKLFGDVETRIFNKLKNKCDIEVLLKKENYMNTVETYPIIGDERKKELIAAIGERNKVLCRNRNIEIEL